MMQTPVLIVNDDPIVRRKLRRMLEVAGYAVAEVADAESGLVALQESERSMVVLFNVVLFNNIMAGTDGIALLGAAAGDAHLADRHAFVLVTPTPEAVAAVLGRLLTRLSVPVVAEPCDPDKLRLTVARAARRLLVPA
jgi:DNA-binding NtrC family response regulator